MNPKDEGVAVGQVVGAQGLDGSVRVLPTTDFPERLLRLRAVWWGTLQGDPQEVVAVRPHGRLVVMRFRTVSDRTAAERLRGPVLWVPRQSLPPLPAGEYYWFQLTGLTVVEGASGRMLGRVARVLRTGAHDLLEVERSGRPPLLIPALRQMVRRVDLEQRRVEVELPPGLEDLS